MKMHPSQAKAAKFELRRMELEPLPDFDRLFASEKPIPEQTIAAIEAKATTGDEQAIRDLLHATIRLCRTIEKLPSDTIRNLRESFDYWPEAKRLRANGRSIRIDSLWTQYALNALRTIRDAHSLGWEIMREIGGAGSHGGESKPIAASRKRNGSIAFAADSGEIVLIPRWQLLAMHMAIWPETERGSEYYWRAAEEAILQFWEESASAKKVAYSQVQAQISKSGKLTEGRLRDAALKEIRRSFERLLFRQIQDTICALGPKWAI